MQGQRSLAQPQMAGPSFAQVRSTDEPQNSNSLDPEHVVGADGAPSAGEEQEQVVVKSFQDVDGPVKAEEAASIDKANEENAGDEVVREAEQVHEEEKTPEEVKIEASMDYSMEAEDVKASDLVAGQ